jgi:undecaprenyl-diphosphatase
MKKTYLWGLGLLLLGLSFLLDNSVVKLIQAIRFTGLDRAMIGFSNIGDKYVLLILLTLFLMYDKKKRKFVVPYWMTFVISLVAVAAFKTLIARDRPDTIISLIEETHFSFPSGHATIAFSSLPIVYKSFKQNKKFWLTYVLLIAGSRIYLGVHYLSDVVAGALLGLLIGMFVLKFTKN